jgi:hypothetical protein
MSTTEQPTREDDLIRLIGILAEPRYKGGLSLEEIQSAIARTGEEWSLRTINALLCELGSSRVRHEKVKAPRGKVTKYTLRSAT